MKKLSLLVVAIGLAIFAAGHAFAYSNVDYSHESTGGWTLDKSPDVITSSNKPYNCGGGKGGGGWWGKESGDGWWHKWWGKESGDGWWHKWCDKESGDGHDAVPIPSAILLLGSGILGLVGIRMRSRRKS